QVVLLLQDEGRRGRLQERRRASPLHLGARQDPLPPDHRRVPAPPAAGRARDQAGPRDGAPPLRRRGPGGPGRAARAPRPRGAGALMQVVLRQDVEKLGLPRGLAEPATPGLVRELARREAERARHEAKTVEEAQAIAARLERLELRFDVNAGPTGALFGSVTATNVADRLWEQEKIRVDRRKLGLEPIKRVGHYAVPVEVFAGVTAEL